MSRSEFVSAGVRDYVQRWGAREHPVLARCREETAAMPNANMQISCEQGAFMQTMVAAIHARRALEVGVFTGYSSTAMALAMQAIHGDDALRRRASTPPRSTPPGPASTGERRASTTSPNCAWGRRRTA